jgi:hypothetical protein
MAGEEKTEYDVDEERADGRQRRKIINESATRAFFLTPTVSVVIKLALSRFSKPRLGSIVLMKTVRQT